MPPQTAAPNKALFLDRDGVINHDYGYVHKQADFVFVDGIFELALAAKQRGYLLIVVTNQAGIGRGYYSEADFAGLMAWVKQCFAERGAALDAIFYCPCHASHGIGKYKKESFFRKPQPGMLLQAAKEHRLHLPSSALVGDSPKDIQAGLAAGLEKLFFYAPDGGNVEGARSVTTLPDIISFL